MAEENASPLKSDLRDRVLERFGLGSLPSIDLDGLRTLYNAWCLNVPFDNVRKMIALRSSGSDHLPGGDADEFFENWLAHGSGGTCWATSNALHDLLGSVGFNASRIAGAMRDLPILNHGTVRVDIDRREWLVDSSMLHNIPIPLDREVFVGDDPILPVEVEPIEEEEHRAWFLLPSNAAYMPCRLTREVRTHTFYRESYESTRDRGPFNQRLYVRRNRPGEQLIIMGNSRVSRTAKGTSVRDLSRDELPRILHEEIGISESLIDRWIGAGCFDASFEPYTGPEFPPLTEKPPSKR